MAGAKAARLTLELVTDNRDASRGLDQTERRLGRFGQTAAKVGKAAAVGLGAGLAAAAVGAVKLGQAAAEDEAGQKRLERALRNTAGATDRQVSSVERWITAQGKALGVADDELRPALGRLAASTGDVDKAQRLARLAMDVSAGSGLKLENVAKLLAKANDGQVAGLSKLGIATKDASGKTLDFDTLTGRLAQTFKGQASTAANTTAGQYQRLKLRLSEAGETIGSKLLPVGNRLIGWALKLAPRVEKLAGDLGRRLGPAFRAVGSFITQRVVPAAQTFYRWFVERIVPGIRSYVTPIIEGLRRAFARVSEKVSENAPQLRRLGGVLRDVAEFIVRKVAPVVGKTLGTAFETLGTAIGVVLDVVGRLVDAFDAVKRAVEKAIDAIRNIPKVKLPDLPNPFGRTAGLVGGTAGAGDLGFGSVVINVTGALDPDAVARQIDGILTARRRRLGAPA